MRFKRTEQTKHGLIHEDEDDDHDNEKYYQILQITMHDLSACNGDTKPHDSVAAARQS
jgi:hypothetical protein